MADSDTKLSSAIRTSLIGLVPLAVVAAIYVLTRWLDPNAATEIQTMITGGIAVILLGAWWLASRAWKSFRAKRARDNVTKAAGDKISIVVAALKDDDGGKIADRVVISLREQFGDRVEVIPIDETIVQGKQGSIDIRELAARKAGQDLLARTQADVLIWGAALREDRVTDLNFLARESDDGPHGARSYTLNPTMRLPAEFGQDLSSALAAVAASAAAPAVDNAGAYLVPVLMPIAARLRHLVENLPASLKGNSRADVVQAYAVVTAAIGEQTGDSEFLRHSISAYGEVLKIWTRERAPLQWAATQNNLGNALQSLGWRESDTARLEAAVSACREALKEHTRERMPLQWARSQNSLGTALGTLGGRESGTVRLEEAVAAFREALKEHTRERVPLDWAMTQNNLGTALGSLGEREGGTSRLEEAVAAFRESLKERTRERVPLKWAMTQNNLGNALGTLGERESGTVRLEEAVFAYREALKEFTRERLPVQWATTQSNLGTALQTLGTREGGMVRLEEAVFAYREALKEFTRERSALQWSTTQNNLGAALGILGEHESGTARFEEAITCLRVALEEGEKAGTTHYTEGSRRNLARAEQALAERRAGKN